MGEDAKLYDTLNDLRNYIDASILASESPHHLPPFTPAKVARDKKALMERLISEYLGDGKGPDPEVQEKLKHLIDDAQNADWSSQEDLERIKKDYKQLLYQ